jgi:hypothetical protein
VIAGLTPPRQLIRAGLVFHAPLISDAVEAIGNISTTAIGSPTWGGPNNGLTLNGSSQYITAAASNSQTFVGVQSWSMLIYPTAIPTSGNQFVVVYGADYPSTTSAFRYVDMYWNAGTPVLRWSYGAGVVTWALATIGLSVNNKYRLTFRSLGNNTEKGNLVFNDVNKGVGSGATNMNFVSATAAATTIGAMNVSGTYGRFFPGKICDLRIYNRYLTDAECYAIYRGQG